MESNPEMYILPLLRKQRIAFYKAEHYSKSYQSCSHPRTSQYFIELEVSVPLMSVPCHYSMARTRVADRGNGLQLWRVAANTLNKQPWETEKGWYSGLGLDVGLTTSHYKK
jgi:hypothetical protein